MNKLLSEFKKKLVLDKKDVIIVCKCVEGLMHLAYGNNELFNSIGDYSYTSIEV